MGLNRFFKNVLQLSNVVLPTEERGYPITGNSSGFFNYYNTFLGDLHAPYNRDFDITSLTAMRISTVFTCVLVRAESLASLPLSVLQATKTGSRTAYNHPAYRLIHNKPNPFQTASDFWKSVSAHIDLYGNCFAHISYSGGFQPKRIDLIPDPCAVQIQETKGGDAYYEYDGKRYEDYEILHFKDISLDGYYGSSKIKLNADTIGYSGKLRTFGKNAIGTKPPGYFSTDAPFDLIKKQENSLAQGWSDNIAIGKTPVLPLGLKYNNLQISPGDAQYLEAINATKEDIYGIFRIPPTLAQNYERATFANAEQQDLVFIKYTMLPLITNIEQECNAKLFSESNVTSETPYYVKFNVNAFMRGDFKSRAEGYRSLFNIGAINGDTIAELEDWNKWEGGQERFVPMNMIPLSRIEEFANKMTEPTAPPADSVVDLEAARAEFIKTIKRNGTKVNGHAN